MGGPRRPFGVLGVFLVLLGAGLILDADRLWLGTGLTLVGAACLLRRWRLLLRPIADVTMLPLVSATSIGFFCNMVLPLRVGEVVRPVLLARRRGLATSSVLGSVLLERLLDMVTILLFLGIVVALVPVS